MAPLVDLAARRNFLNNAELVRRLQAVGEHQKAAMIYRSHHGHADRMQLHGARQQGYLNAAHAAELHENEADLAADMAEGFLGGDVGSATRYKPVARIEAVKATAQGEDVSGKLPHRYGLQLAPTFESAIQTKLHKTTLPSGKIRCAITYSTMLADLVGTHLWCLKKTCVDPLNFEMG